MTQQFTASEVRELAKHMESVGWRPDSNGDSDCCDEGAARSAEMLFAFAGLLEAREKAVPVVTRESAINALAHVGQHNGPGRETEARQMLVEGSPSAARSAQAQPPAARVTDAMDAARYRWLLKTQNTDCEYHSLEDLAWYVLHNLSSEETSNDIDAAMAKESGNG